MGGEKQIIAEIEAYIRQGGGGHSDWFIGLTDNPITPIMEVTKHRKVQNHRFSYIETASPQVARAVADHFLKVCGTDGSLGDVDTNTLCRSLYVYKKTANLKTSKTSVPVQT